MVSSPRFRLAVILFGALLYGCGAKAGGEADDKAESAPVAVELTPVQKKDIATLVSVQGVVAPSQGSSVKVGAVSAGRIANVFVKEGENVSAGELVAILDNKMQIAQSDSANAALMVAEAQASESSISAKSAELDQITTLKIASLAVETAKAERQAALKQAVFELQSAQLELRKSMSGNRPQEVAQAEQTERQALVAKDSAEREEKRNALLLEKGIVSRKAYDDSKAALQNAVASLVSAQSQLSLMREGARAEDKQTARLKAETAAQALQSARQIQDQKVLQAETALKQAQQSELQVQAKRKEAEAMKRAVTQRAADAGVARATQAQLEVRSPISGRVIRRFLNPGDTPDNNTPILEIVSPKGGMDLVASVPSANGTTVSTGMKAVLSFGASEAIDVSGAVISVGQVDPLTGLLALRIHIATPPGWLKPGTFATAKIFVRRHQGATVVPKSALLTRDGSSIVFVAKGEKAVLTKVEIGAEQDGLVEILKGLEPGQSVVSLGNYELSDGAAIKVGPADDKTDSADKKKDDDKSESDKKDDKKPAGAGPK